ncbi:8765_t:CDS:2 [Diversispora eburnea]|uniref:ribonuclease H n=1 Tax=Diversispora eburnea TaxID=1213867 RepID=A0A9N8VFG9_9GLOM|nr:8765_t:CDS:2 [Diversispora eburnea]
MAKRLLRNLFKAYINNSVKTKNAKVRNKPFPKTPKSSISRLLLDNSNNKIKKKELIKAEFKKMPRCKNSYYAVRVGHRPGVYNTWDECKLQVSNFPRCKFKKFANIKDAQEFVYGNIEPISNDSPLPSSSMLDTFKPKKKDVKNVMESSLSPITKDDDETSDSDVTKLMVWTDGCSLNNGQSGARAGIGVFWSDNNPRNLSERLPGPRQTNNRAEIMAIIRALETCPNDNITLEVKTDSKYVMKAYQSWIPNWEKNGWKNYAKKDVENKDLFTRMIRLIRARPGNVLIVTDDDLFSPEELAEIAKEIAQNQRN